jgi:hypothetical protein
MVTMVGWEEHSTSLRKHSGGTGRNTLGEPGTFSGGIGSNTLRVSGKHSIRNTLEERGEYSWNPPRNIREALQLGNWVCFERMAEDISRRTRGTTGGELDKRSGRLGGTL